MSDLFDEKSRRGAGGTPGGIVEFLVGTMLLIAGGFLITNQVTVVSRGFYINFGSYRFGGFGLALLPLLIGVAMLFYNGRSLLGWLLTAAGGVIILVGVLSNLDIYFQPTSLFNTLLMFFLVAAGLGLVMRGLRPH